MELRIRRRIGWRALQIDPQILAPLARKYVWRKTPEQALESPRRISAQVRNMGDPPEAALASPSIAGGPGMRGGAGAGRG